MKYPLVSIIIVNWNGKDLLSACLASFKKVDYPRMEIIVVDNGSTDGSVEMSRRFRVKLIKNKENLGFVGGNNQGFAEARGKYVLLINNDTEVEPDFLKILVGVMESRPKVAAVQPKIILKSLGKLQSGSSFFTSNGFLHHYGFLKDPDDPVFNKEMKIFSANGACVLIRKEIVDKTGGLFDPDFFAYFEESDFCWRMILAGYDILYYPQAVIYHKGRQTSRRLTSGFTQYHSFKNRLCSLLKNLSAKEAVKVLPVHIVFSGIWIGGFIVTGKFESALSIPRAYWWNLRHLKETWQKRRFVQDKIRRIPDSKIMKELKRRQELGSYLLFFYKMNIYKG